MKGLHATPAGNNVHARAHPLSLLLLHLPTYLSPSLLTLFHVSIHISLLQSFSCTRLLPKVGRVHAPTPNPISETLSLSPSPYFSFRFVYLYLSDSIYLSNSLSSSCLSISIYLSLSLHIHLFFSPFLLSLSPSTLSLTPILSHPPSRFLFLHLYDIYV